MESSLETAEPQPGALAQPSAAVRRRHRNPRGQGARLTGDIVSGALALIERAGSAEAVTLRAVAREVGIAAPSIYAHFPNRDAVLMAVVARVFDELTEAIKKGQKSAGQDPAGRLIAGCAAYVAFGLEHPARYGSGSRSGPTAGRCSNTGPRHSRSSSRTSRTASRQASPRAPTPSPMPPPCGSRCTGPSACARRYRASRGPTRPHSSAGSCCRWPR